MAVDAKTPKRRRRSPEQAEREILDAAEEFLREHSFAEMTVEDLMERTGLSRPSFYVYFKDRQAVVMRLVQEVAGEIAERGEPPILAAEGDPADNLRDALRGVISVYADHGRVLRAIADAASADETVAVVFDAFLEHFVDLADRQIQRVRADRGPVPRRRDVARALVLMSELTVRNAYGGGDRPDPETLIEPLVHIWDHAVYRD